MKHWTFGQFVVSSLYPDIAAQIHPNPFQCSRLAYGVSLYLDDLWESMGGDVVVSSGLRDHTLNLKVGGSENSDHLHGCAVDLVSDNLEALFGHIMLLGGPYRQIRYYREKRFIHLSWNVPEVTWKHEWRIV